MQKAFMRNVALLAMLNTWRTALLADTPELRLFTGAAVLDENTVIGDLPAPTGDWYAADAAPVVSEIFDDEAGVYKLAVGSSMFNYTGSDPPETITGACLVGTALGLIASWNLPTPVVMGNTLDTVVTPVAALQFPPVVGPESS